MEWVAQETFPADPLAQLPGSSFPDPRLHSGWWYLRWHGPASDTDGRQVHARLQQVNRTTVPHAVRMQSLAGQRGAGCDGLPAVLGENVADAKSGQSLAAPAAEDGGIGAQVEPRFRDELLQHLCRLRPERTNPGLAPFAEELHLWWRFELEIIGTQIPEPVRRC